MKYCVIKDSTTIIDKSETNTDKQFAVAYESAGFIESQIEILTKEQYKERKVLEPQPPQPPTAEDRLAAIEMALIELTLGGM